MTYFLLHTFVQAVVTIHSVVKTKEINIHKSVNARIPLHTTFIFLEDNQPCMLTLDEPLQKLSEWLYLIMVILVKSMRLVGPS